MNFLGQAKPTVPSPTLCGRAHTLTHGTQADADHSRAHCISAASRACDRRTRGCPHHTRPALLLSVSQGRILLVSPQGTRASSTAASETARKRRPPLCPARRADRAACIHSCAPPAGYNHTTLRPPHAQPRTHTHTRTRGHALHRRLRTTRALAFSTTPQQQHTAFARQRHMISVLTSGGTHRRRPRRYCGLLVSTMIHEMVT